VASWTPGGGAAIVVALVAGFLALQAIPFGGNQPASAAAAALRSTADKSGHSTIG